LHQQIDAHFNEEELRTFCFKFGVDYDNLGGRGKSDKARELVDWAERQGRLSDLRAAVKAARPHLADSTALLPPPHIPFHENKLFTGREEWLTQLHEAFAAMKRWL
jgi:hypothetical protein